jgi:dihydrolipoamide dehydrogenase
VYAALGTNVSVVEMTPNLMPGTDPELVSVLAKRLAGLFEAIILNTTVAKIEEQKGALKVVLEAQDGLTSEKSCDKVLVAVGRRPNSDGIGLENTKVQIDDKGFVSVNS